MSRSFEIGDAIETLEIVVSPDQVRRYATAANMPGQRFYSDEVARREGLPGQILPGNLSLALIARALLESIPGATLEKIGVTFRGIVLPGKPIRVSGFVTESRAEEGRTIVECDLVLECEGERRVTAVATASVPGPAASR